MDMSQERQFVKEKVVKCVVEVIKRTWPQLWPDLLPDLTGICKMGVCLCVSVRVFPSQYPRRFLLFAPNGEVLLSACSCGRLCMCAHVAFAHACGCAKESVISLFGDH